MSSERDVFGARTGKRGPRSRRQMLEDILSAIDDMQGQACPYYLTNHYEVTVGDVDRYGLGRFEQCPECGAEVVGVRYVVGETPASFIAMKIRDEDKRQWEILRATASGEEERRAAMLMERLKQGAL